MEKRKKRWRKFKYSKDCRSWWYVSASTGKMILLTIGTINKKPEQATIVYPEGEDLIMDARWAIAVMRNYELVGVV